jgi:cellulose biosynthesis protein BcsQ
MPLFAFVEVILDAIDWSKLIFGGTTITIAIGVVYYIANYFAKRSVQNEMQELKSNLRIEQNSHKVTKDEKHLCEMGLQSMRAQQTTLMATIDSQQTTLRLKDEEIAKQQQNYAKVWQAGNKLYKQSLAHQELQDAHKKLLIELKEAQQQIEQMQSDILGKDEKHQLVLANLTAREAELELAERRMKRVRKLSGYIIKAKALQSRPKFRPLAERQRAIIAMSALKGGVGKTTLTAHLAGAFARAGYRVLLVDLDLQGSLSGMMLPPEELHRRVKEKLMMQDFFMKAMSDKTTKLTRYITEVKLPDDVPGRISIAPTSDRLSYAELNLTLGWLLKQGERDARFLLRRALHLKVANTDYDIVLIDCPPALNISSANALAAADYVVIPTLLTPKSAERVPALVVALEDESFVRHLNSELRILGVVANRTRFETIKGAELVQWQNLLPEMLASKQKRHTRLFQSTIAMSADLAPTEETYIPLAEKDRAFRMFEALMLEIEKELPDACRRPHQTSS